MNGINYNTLLGNTGLFSQQTNTVADELKYKGTSTKEKTTDKKQTNADHDTVEINGEAGQLQKAGYDRPKCTVRQQQTSKYKQIDENGIQEGVQLSSAAKKLLKELQEKYSNMEISVAEWSSDEEQDYYASKCTKDYSVLISPEALEQMAADESVREKYEAILDGAGESSKKMQEELGDDVKKIQSFTITIDKDGKVSYAVKLIQDFAKHNEKRTEEAKKAQQAKKEEEKKADKKKEEEKKAETPANIPLFTLQGNFDVKKLHGIYRLMMEIMVKTAGKGLAEKKDRTPEEDDMLDMMLHSGERVKAENLSAILDWYRAQQ